MFNPARSNIGDILNASSQYVIPVYQRDYNWGKDEALEFMEDLQSYASVDGESLFLGNIILESTREKKTSVVDGQQRLTTILLLLIACRQRALQLKWPALAQMILGRITFVDPATGESKGARLIASDSVRDVFAYIATDSWDQKFPNVVGKKPVKRQVNRVRPIYDYFRAEVSKLDKEKLSQFLTAIYNCYVIRIDIENEIDALAIFERTNARGMELQISDLLKNHLFAKKVPGIEGLWPQIVDNSGGTLLRMLKYFYIAKKEHVLKPQLYKKLKGFAAELTPQQFTEQLLEFSWFYQVAKSGDEAAVKNLFHEKQCTELSAHQHRHQRIAWSLQALGEFGITQFYPPAHAAIECLIRNGGSTKPGDAKALIELFEAFEKYHFINNAICERVGNEVEKLYADSCGEFAKSKNFAKTAGELVGEMRKRLAKEEEFVANFVEITYSTETISFLSYIFDRFNNWNLDPSQHVRIYNPDPKLLRRNHNIEHFMPQNPDPVFKVQEDTLSMIDNIGNLLAISYKTNSRLGNGSPTQKILRLKKELSKEIQNLSYVTEFVDSYAEDASSWGKEKIEKRAREMALKAYREVWKIK